MKRSLIGGAFLLGVILLFYFIILDTNTSPKLVALKATDREFTIGISQDPVAWLAVLAAEGGFFEQQGLKPVVKSYPSGKRALYGMFNNEVDYSTSAGIPVSIAAFGRQDFKILCTLGSGDNEVQIVARRDQGIETSADLTDRAIATQEASAVHFFLDMFLMQQHLEGKVRQRFLRKEDLADALVRGEVDAISTREPFLSAAVNKLGDKSIIFSSPGLYRKASHLTVKKEVLAAKSNQATAILQAMLAARQMLQEEPERAIQIISTATGVKTNEVRALLGILDLRPRLNQSILTSLEDGANWATSIGLIGGAEVPNYLQLIHPQSLSELRPEAVSIIH